MWYRAPWWAGIAEICEITHSTVQLDIYINVLVYIYICIAM